MRHGYRRPLLLHPRTRYPPRRCWARRMARVARLRAPPATRTIYRLHRLCVCPMDAVSLGRCDTIRSGIRVSACLKFNRLHCSLVPSAGIRKPKRCQLIPAGSFTTVRAVESFSSHSQVIAASSARMGRCRVLRYKKHASREPTRPVRAARSENLP